MTTTRHGPHHGFVAVVLLSRGVLRVARLVVVAPSRLGAVVVPVLRLRRFDLLT